MEFTPMFSSLLNNTQLMLLCFISFPLSPSVSLHHIYSFLFLQLYHSVRGAAVSQLPSGVRQQYALRVADHHQS